jgi:hypothetical protein
MEKIIIKVIQKKFKITWLIDGKPLEAKTKFKPHYDIYTNLASLKIENFRPEDAGSYTCVAENNVGKDQTSADGVVIKTPNIDERPNVDPEKFKDLGKTQENKDIENEEKKDEIPPLVIEPLVNFKVYEGGDHRLVCKVDGYPKPKVFD